MIPPPALMSVNHSTGRHLGLGRAPSGKNNRISGNVTIAGTNGQVPSHPANDAPGR